MDWLPHPFDLESRALWHLELLGCFEPGDAVAPYLPPPPQPRDFIDDEGDDDLSCTRCAGEAFCEVDDPFWDECDEFGWGPCVACRGTGLRKHQWIF